MKLKLVVLLIVLLIMTGCAPIKPARVENGLYINPTFQFSLHVPDGWEVSEKIPVLIEKELSFVTKHKIKTTFSNFDNKCFILVSAETTETDWMSFKMYADKVIASLDTSYAKDQKKFLSKPESKYYRYKVYRDKIENCNKDCLAAKVEFNANDLKSTGYNIIYNHNGMVYTTTLILLARDTHYENSLRVFQTVVDSFRVY